MALFGVKLALKGQQLQALQLQQPPTVLSACLVGAAQATRQPAARTPHFAHPAPLGFTQQATLQTLARLATQVLPAESAPQIQMPVMRSGQALPHITVLPQLVADW